MSALTSMLAGWGVTADKDLLLDETAVAQLVGLGPEVPVVTSYDSHPIVNDLNQHCNWLSDLAVTRTEEWRSHHRHQTVFHVRQQLLDL